MDRARATRSPPPPRGAPRSAGRDREAPRAGILRWHLATGGSCGLGLAWKKADTSRGGALAGVRRHVCLMTLQSWLHNASARVRAMLLAVLAAACLVAVAAPGGAAAAKPRAKCHGHVTKAKHKKSKKHSARCKRRTRRQATTTSHTVAAAPAASTQNAPA